MKMRIAGVAIALACVAGCSGLRTYPNDAAKNLVVRTQADGKVRTVMHVHQVDAKCQTEYQGTVALDRAAVEVGIPHERFSYLVVTFDTSSLLSGSSTTSVGTLLRPRAGYGYDVTVTYRQNIYNLAIRETDLRRNYSREITRRDVSTCWFS